MATYQDVIATDVALVAWAFSEPSGLDFAPYIGGQHLTGSGAFDYQQAGPIAASFGLRAHVGAKAQFTFALVVNPPFSTEVWVKIPANPPSATVTLWYSGNSGANGSGFYINTDSHLHFLEGGRTDNDTGIIWPDTNWHLFQGIAAQDGVTVSIGLDGVMRSRKAYTAAIAPSPNALSFFAPENSSAGILTTLALPALYAYEMTAAQVANHFLASTNPGAAISNTLQAGGGLSGTNTDLLNKILAAVQKTFPRT